LLNYLWPDFAVALKQSGPGPEESKLKNKIKIVREEDKATWV